MERRGRAVRHQQTHQPVFRLLRAVGIRETRKETRERKRPVFASGVIVVGLKQPIVHRQKPMV